MGGESPRFGPAARLFMRAARAVVVANVRLRGGIPEVATCADVQRSKRKRREVAKAVHDELVGREDSMRRLRSWNAGMTPVAARFPGGWRDVEPLVLEACESSGCEERTYGLTISPLSSELFRR